MNETSNTCMWKENYEESWHTECGRVAHSENSGPLESGFKFCPYCGKELVESPFAEGEGEGEGEDVGDASETPQPKTAAPVDPLVGHALPEDYLP